MNKKVFELINVAIGKKMPTFPDGIINDDYADGIIDRYMNRKETLQGKTNKYLKGWKEMDEAIKNTKIERLEK